MFDSERFVLVICVVICVCMFVGVVLCVIYLLESNKSLNTTCAIINLETTDF